jgi:hypothetical protein
MRELLSIRGVVSLSLLFYGGVELTHVGGHARAPAKPCKLGVYDYRRVRNLTCARGSYISSSGGGRGYIMAYTTFYERGCGVPSHWFLLSLLLFCGLELHHLTSPGILHIAAFVTLCEAYLRIEPHFNLWNYFFHARLRPSSDVKVVVWVDIFVRSRLGINLYFCFLLSNPLVGWQKVWFFLRNDTDVPLPMFTGCRLIP